MSNSTDQMDSPNAIFFDNLSDIPLPFVGFLLNKAAQEVTQQVDANLRPFGIRIKHYSILLFLSMIDVPLPQKTIGEQLLIDRNTMVSLIDDLEAQALVIRTRDPNDRRYYAIHITDKGRDLLEKVSNIVGEANAKFVEALNHEEHEQLLKLLMKLLRHKLTFTVKG